MSFLQRQHRFSLRASDRMLTGSFRLVQVYVSGGKHPKGAGSNNKSSLINPKKQVERAQPAHNRQYGDCRALMRHSVFY